MYSTPPQTGQHELRIVGHPVRIVLTMNNLVAHLANYLTKQGIPGFYIGLMYSALARLSYHFKYEMPGEKRTH